MRTLLGLYIVRRVTLAIIGSFLGFMAVAYLVDLVELIRRAGERGNIGIVPLAYLGLLRAPALGEQILPFAVLFGAMISLLNLSRRMELVVLRAAGISAWQFLRPAILVAAGLGLLSALAYNPVAAALKERAEALERTLLSRSAAGLDAWLSQEGIDGPSILHAERSFAQGTVLTGVTAFVFARDGTFEERVEAETAYLERERWVLTQVVVHRPDRRPDLRSQYILPTFLTPAQVRESLASPKAVSFWALPGYIAIAERAGLTANRYRLQYHSLLARPVLFAAMVLIAGCVSLGLFRLGNVGAMILGGVAAGFLLYVMGKVAEDLGGAGIVNPGLAAWSPSVVACLLGLTVLLYREDG